MTWAASEVIFLAGVPQRGSDCCLRLVSAFLDETMSGERGARLKACGQLRL